MIKSIEQFILRKDAIWNSTSYMNIYNLFVLNQQARLSRLFNILANIDMQILGSFVFVYFAIILITKISY